jgi:hypothetical protein
MLVTKTVTASVRPTGDSSLVRAHGYKLVEHSAVVETKRLPKGPWFESGSPEKFLAGNLCGR